MRRDNLARAAPVFAALGDETRLYLVAQLAAHGPQSIATLTADANVTRQAITKHLEVLEGAGVVRSTRDGRERRLTLQPRGFDDVRTSLDRISAQWDRALDRLRALVETD